MRCRPARINISEKKKTKQDSERITNIRIFEGKGRLSPHYYQDRQLKELKGKLHAENKEKRI
jgi:hypothetical protein